MEQIDLLYTIFAGVFFGLVAAGALFLGLAEARKHKEDATMPTWAWACIAVPCGLAALSLFIVSSG